MATWFLYRALRKAKFATRGVEVVARVSGTGAFAQLGQRRVDYKYTYYSVPYTGRAVELDGALRTGDEIVVLVDPKRPWRSMRRAEVFEVDPNRWTVIVVG